MTAPTAYLLDSPELAAAAFGLGIAHPPGEALALLCGKLFCLLPIGSIALRVGLSQAAAGAVAAVLVFRLACNMCALVDGGPDESGRLWRHILASGSASLAFAFAPGVILVANRPEVYALQAALSFGALLLALHGAARGDLRAFLGAALLIGLGVANHPLVAGLTGLGGVAAALPHLRGRTPAVRLVCLSVVLFFVGALVLVYLPARASALFANAAGGADTPAWGDARTARGLWWLLSAETFTAKAAVVHQVADAWDLPFAFFEELGLPLGLCAPAGLFLLLRRAANRRLAVPLLVTCVGSAAAALVGGFDPTNPDIRGYLAVAIGIVATLAVLLPVAVAPLLTRAGPRGYPRQLLAWLPLALAGLQVAALPPGVSLRHAAAADRVAGTLQGELPARAALFTGHFETAFVVAYHRLVEGRRPDVAWTHLGFVRGPGYTERLALAEPALAPVLESHGAGPLTLPSVVTLDRTRPVRFEPDSHLSTELRRSLSPAGLTWGLVSGTAATAPALDEFSAIEAGRDRQVRGFVAWRAFGDATLACDNGERETAKLRLAELARLLPSDQRVHTLAATCHPTTGP